MSRAVVTGGLGFLGFELCLAILEEGLEVVAADIDQKAGERWLEVGRNANITYQPLHQALPTEFSGARIYINLYDCFSRSKGKQQLEDIRDFVENNKSYLESAVVLMPSVLSNRIEDDELTGFIEFLEEQFSRYYSVYIPTLFGPRQPDSFLFQQVITGAASGTGFVDDTRSAIFVKDAANSIINIEENSAENIQLVSDTPDSWIKSLKILGRTDADIPDDRPVREMVPSGAKKIAVKPSSSLKEVLGLQRNC
ncbi:hypothetical protein ACOJQI_06295 [Bacillus salacetis]|uniref:hypothetical protein n=1 Tax=Bacillus salacetis TaxID=2315464 RepID=UPI003BA2FA76